MARSVYILAIVLSVVLLVTPVRQVRAAEGGGSNCAACTLVFQLVFNLADVHNESVERTLENFCTLLPGKLADECVLFVSKYGAEIAQVLAMGGAADDICHALNVCTDPECRIFPKSSGSGKVEPMDGSVTIASPWDWLKDLLEKMITTWTSDHLPIKDIDGDKFSTMKGFRGDYWRGKDCNDVSKKVYPGRRNTTLPALYDHNCNGISGSDGLFQSYEKMWCSGSEQRGIAILGDSATAHFRIPESYMNASEITKSTFNNLPSFIANEADWPHRSWGTGHLNDTTGDCQGPLQSLYLQMLERNRCMMRDFQNIGVNGARTNSMKPPGIITSLARDPENDHPLLVVYSLIGNDVCNSRHSIDSMTTPQDFEANVLSALDYLDANLPNGSHVVFLGLVDGRILWNSMHDRIHPLGCTYEQLYDYMNCLYISPCWGWMNSNATVRNQTWDRASQLNAVYPKIISEHSYKNFDMAYYDTPLDAAVVVWEKMGGHAYQLIEPIDGEVLTNDSFHPSQLANALIAEILFKEILLTNPDFIGPVNPNNQNIIDMFGDQGGY